MPYLRPEGGAYLYPMTPRALLLFVKNPIPGKTKTRLAASVGNERALVMYDRLQRYTRDQAAALEGVTLYLHYSDHVPEEDLWPADRFLKLVQRGEGLGQRMEAAFQHAFARGHERVCIIGSDCPGVTTELLGRAFAALETEEVVLGPALDGGYYLLGLRHLHPTLFRDMEWSTERVAEETLARAGAQGLGVGQLEVLRDVDHLEDWESYGWEVPPPSAGPSR